MNQQTKYNSIISCAFILLVAYVFLATCSIASAKQFNNINEILMETTFKIVGPAKKDVNKRSIGTVFLLGKPSKTQPKRSFYVLVTAAHVLEDIYGDDATILLRIKQVDGSYTKVPFNIKIRNNGQPVYVRNKKADVAAMYISIPSELSDLPLVPTTNLAGDKEFEKYEMHPGDELLCLGYPLIVEANDAGFPILRSGKIASYPLYPAKLIKYFLFDFNIFGGNSGGPVYGYFNGKVFGNQMHFDMTLQLIFGLVSQQVTALPEFNNQSISLAVVVPAQFIIETIGLLPDVETKQ